MWTDVTMFLFFVLAREKRTIFVFNFFQKFPAEQKRDTEKNKRPSGNNGNKPQNYAYYYEQYSGYFF